MKKKTKNSRYSKKKVLYRSSITGRFVSKRHAKGHPKITTKEHR